MAIDWSKLSKKAVAIFVVLLVLSLVSLGLGIALAVRIFTEQWPLLVATVVITAVTIGLWYATYRYYKSKVAVSK